MQIYVSGPLQSATDLGLARALYFTIGRAVHEAGFEPYLPHLFTDPEEAADLEAIDVYRRDVQALSASVAMVAHVGAPSLGVGAELAIATGAALPVIAVARTSEPVSRFAAGLLEDAGAQVWRFRDSEGLRYLLVERLRTLFAHGPIPNRFDSSQHQHSILVAHGCP